MKKLITLSILSILVAAPILAYEEMEVPQKYSSFTDIIGEGGPVETITNYIFTALIVFAVIMIIIAGFGFLTAGGDPIKAGTARSQLMYALIAIAIGALAKGLVFMIAEIMS